MDVMKMNISISTRARTLTSLDYSIMLYMFANYIDWQHPDKSIPPTNLMWELHMCPTHYKMIKKSCEVLLETGMLAKTQCPRESKRPKTRYWLTAYGLDFIGEIINRCQEHTISMPIIPGRREVDDITN
jgi:predicted transcriptional regulator